MVWVNDGDRLLIGNNLGKVNGWASADAVLGKVVAIVDAAPDSAE